MPSPTLTLGGFYKLAVNRESVNLYNSLGVLDTAAATLTDAKRLMQGQGEAESSMGEYLATAIDWRLPDSQVTGTIEAGWTIVDLANVAYVVLDVCPPTAFQTVWKCACRRVDVRGLINAVDWKKFIQTTDAYGDRVTDPANFTFGGHYPARIQPATSADIDLLGKRGISGHFMIYVLPDLDVHYGDLIVDTLHDNATYKVVGWRSKQNLASAFVILGEQQP
jgi:hypothetical protein